MPVRDGRPRSARAAAGGFDDAQIGNAIAAVWKGRTDRYSEIRSANTLRLPKVEMSYIGGEDRR
jgi:hypothetical protein